MLGIKLVRPRSDLSLEEKNYFLFRVFLSFAPSQYSQPSLFTCPSTLINLCPVVLIYIAHLFPPPTTTPIMPLILLILCRATTTVERVLFHACACVRNSQIQTEHLNCVRVGEGGGGGPREVAA